MKVEEINAVLPIIENQTQPGRRAEMLYLLAETRRRLGDKAGAEELEEIALASVREHPVTSASLLDNIWNWAKDNKIVILIVTVLGWLSKDVIGVLGKRLGNRVDQYFERKKERRDNSEKLRQSRIRKASKTLPNGRQVALAEIQYPGTYHANRHG